MNYILVGCPWIEKDITAYMIHGIGLCWRFTMSSQNLKAPCELTTGREWIEILTLRLIKLFASKCNSCFLIYFIAQTAYRKIVKWCQAFGKRGYKWKSDGGKVADYLEGCKIHFYHIIRTMLIRLILCNIMYMYTSAN